MKLFLVLSVVCSVTTACKKENMNPNSWGKVSMVSPIVLGDEQDVEQITGVIDEYWSAWLL